MILKPHTIDSSPFSEQYKCVTLARNCSCVSSLLLLVAWPVHLHNKSNVSRGIYGKAMIWSTCLLKSLVTMTTPTCGTITKEIRCDSLAYL